MSYAYQAVVMLTNENHPSIEWIKEQLQKVFVMNGSIAKIKLQLDRLIIAIDDWQMNIYLHHSPDTVSTSQTIAKLYLEEDNSINSDLSNYNYHIEVKCYPDPQMDRFKYFVSALEVLSNFPGAIIFNPITKGFIE